MKHQKLTSLLLAGALALGLCGVSVLAADPGEDPSAAQGQEQLLQTQEEGVPQGENPEQGEAAQGEKIPEGEESPEGEEVPEEEEEPEDVSQQPQPDPEGVLSFANIASRVRSGDYNYLVLEETIAQVEATDYQQLQEDLRDGLNGMADIIWFMWNNPSASASSQSLQAQYDAMRQQFDDLKEGKIQQDAADTVRQLRSTQDGLVLLAQSMYIQLSELAATDQTLERGLAALDRQIEELELRYELGQVSALTLRQTQAGRTSLVSQRETLAASARSLAMNLQAMTGLELTGKLSLTALPQVGQAELDAMNLEADLEAAKQASYTLYAAQKTLEEAEEDYKQAGRDYNYDKEDYRYIQAEHAWQSAQYTYQGAVQSFELSFRTLYDQVKDYEQVLGAAQTALAVEQDNYRVDQLKYEQGTISHNTLLTAQDDLAAAQDTVDTARRNLFSAYNNYQWAVDCGILN